MDSLHKRGLTAGEGTIEAPSQETTGRAKLPLSRHRWLFLHSEKSCSGKRCQTPEMVSRVDTCRMLLASQTAFSPGGGSAGASPSRSRTWHLLIALVLLLASPLHAEDLIYLQRPGTDNPPPVVGVIDDFNGRFIQYRTSTAQRPLQQPTTLVIKVEHQYSEAFNRAESLFNNGQLDAAAAEWTQELAKESQPWVQREIRARLIRAAWRQDHWTAAGEQFLAIADEDPDTFHWPAAPLLWTPLSLRAADRVVAQGWLNDPRPVARLLGSSLLLKDAVLGEAAAKMLADLVRDPSARISGLAKAQLWRNRLAQPITDPEIASWRSHIAFLPVNFRGGPQYLLGNAYLRRGQFDRAAAELLWVPLTYSQHEPTAARASLEAGESLLRGGRREDAVRILSETVDNFAWSQAAKDAKSRLAELEKDPV